MLIKLLPLKTTSYLLGKLLSLKLPAPIARIATSFFARKYRIDLSDATKTLAEYQSIGELFTRELKPGARAIGDGIISPVDGTLRSVGRIDEDEVIETKGQRYSVGALIGDPDREAIFDGGIYLNYYLSPPDYHHVHSPCEGKIIGWSYIPGYLLPVNDWAFNAVPQLFTGNERLVTFIETPKGVVAVVMVGATNVGKIVLAYDKVCTSDFWNIFSLDDPRSHVYDEPIAVKRGEKLGTFHLGSSAIVLMQPEVCGLVAVPQTPMKVRVGQTILKA